MRKPLLAGNWKMNKTNAEIPGFFEAFFDAVGSAAELFGKRADIVFAVPYTLLANAISATVGRGVAIAAQNVHGSEGGAFTGEISISMLTEVGVAMVLVGHSERRQYYGENDASVAEKTKAALDRGVVPIVCVGETLAEREARHTDAVLQEQMDRVTPLIDATGNTIIAYEPVWAIGSGLTATPAQAQAAHHFIREIVRERCGNAAADELRILYGGSAKPENVAELLKQPDIDGGLVGGASLNPKHFAAMVLSCLES